MGYAGGVGQYADQRPGAPDFGNGPRDRRRGKGRSLAGDGNGNRRSSAGGRIPAHRENGEHDGGAARLVRVGSDARGPRSGYRRKARWAGEGERRRGYVEG